MLVGVPVHSIVIFIPDCRPTTPELNKMNTNRPTPKNAFQLELLLLMLSQEVKQFISNEEKFTDEPDDYVDELSALAFDPNIQEYGNLPLAN
jgi:hypothetical protein